ncbi:hypothetical protein N4Q66_26905, partial [Leclercia adecarboxylata]|uniref:hypothetical protein n=1 Tax=Leclercia adecarboxylata TaxID=83655 RepID=UPI00234E2CBA
MRVLMLFGAKKMARLYMLSATIGIGAGYVSGAGFHCRLAARVTGSSVRPIVRPVWGEGPEVCIPACAAHARPACGFQTRVARLPVQRITTARSLTAGDSIPSSSG